MYINNFNFSCTGLHKRFWMQYVIWLEMAERVFSVELYVFPLFLYNILVDFVMRMQFKDNIQVHRKEWHSFISIACDY